MKVNPWRAALTAALMALAPWAQGALVVHDLRCEYRVDPSGIDVPFPRLSWVLSAPEGARAQSQQAYEVVVASSPEKLARLDGDLWTTGRVPSDQSLQIAYAGAQIGSRAEAFWKVRVWDQDGQASGWSAPAHWSMGLLDQADWKAEWIAAPDASAAITARSTTGSASAIPAVMFRKAFTLPGPVRRATAYVTGLGLYELRLNGRRVGDHVLAPEWTDYRKRIQYQTYDVTERLQRGENVVGSMVGEGWFMGRLMGIPRNAYGTFPRFLMQLEIELADGQRVKVMTDRSWRCTQDGPIRSSGIYDGEVFDGRRAMRGWDDAGFDQKGWEAVRALPVEGPKLVWQRNEPIRITQELRPLGVTEPKPGVFVFDLGQNMVGWCRLRVRGVAGQELVLRHGEMLNDDGTVYTANLRGAPQIDRFIFGEEGESVFEPHFTYHGFRYVELTGLKYRPASDDLAGEVFHSAAAEVAQFQSSNPLINQLMRNILWTERANLMSSPTDCPQRDERFGWMGDIQAFSQAGIFQMDLAAFFSKWVQDIRDDQATDGRYPDYAPHPGDPNQGGSGTPAWGDAGTVIPWRMYQNYGDTRVLQEHFDSARRWIEFIRAHNPHLVWADARGGNFNDWLNADTVVHQGWPKKGGAVPPDVLATAFFAHSTEIVAKMARVLGRGEEARTYEALFARIKQAFNEHFVDPDGKILGDTQAGYALALHFNLLPDTLRPKAMEHLMSAFTPYEGHLSTGIQSTHRLLLELSRNGRNEQADRLVNLRDFPSWGMMIENGATTIWERWDGYVKGRGFQDPGMNSFNHWAFGAVGEWVWSDLAGLAPDERHPAYARFSVHPRPCPSTTWVNCRYDSIRGPIELRWRTESGRFTLDLAVPPNSTATVVLPTRDPGRVKEGGRSAREANGVELLDVSANETRFRVASGRYHFESTFQATAKAGATRP